MNSQGPKKDSYGFKLSSLNKLKETKTADNTSNLLEYLVNYVQKEYPDVFTFSSTLSTVSLARKISLGSIKETISMLRSGISLLKKQLENASSNIVQGDKFIEIMTPFLEKSESDLLLLVDRTEKLEKELIEISQLFDEDKNQVTQKPEEFFEIIDTFMNTWKETNDFLEQKKEKLKKQNQMQMKEVQKKVMKESPIKRQSNGLIDQLQETMRDKKSFQDRRSQRRSIIQEDLQKMKKEIPQ